MELRQLPSVRFRNLCIVLMSVIQLDMIILLITEKARWHIINRPFTYSVVLLTSYPAKENLRYERFQYHYHCQVPGHHGKPHTCGSDHGFPSDCLFPAWTLQEVPHRLEYKSSHLGVHRQSRFPWCRGVAANLAVIQGDVPAACPSILHIRDASSQDKRYFPTWRKSSFDQSPSCCT